mgnify:FL=1
MVTRILKWGNSLGLRIPKSFAKQAGVEEGSSVDIALEGDHLVIRKTISKEYQLADLLSEVREGNIHDETATGKAVGREVW